MGCPSSHHPTLRTRAVCARMGAVASGAPSHPALAHSDPLSFLSALPSPRPPSSVWLLLKNPTFILLCLAGATEATLIAGMSTFGPKFLESQFSLSASEAATLFGEKFLKSWESSAFSLVSSRKPDSATAGVHEHGHVVQVGGPEGAGDFGQCCHTVQRSQNRPSRG